MDLAAEARRDPLDWRYFASALGVALAYVVLGRLGLELATYQPNATLVWPPSGLSLAVLLLFGRRYWIGVLLGAFVVNVWIGSSWPAAIGISTGNTLEAVIGAWLLNRGGFRPELARMRDVVLFGGVALLCSAVGASVGVAVLGATGGLDGADPARVWSIWYLGDVGGAVLLAPLIFVVLRGRPGWGELVGRHETWVVVVLLTFTCAAAFGGWIDAYWLTLLASLASFPLLMWTGLRMGPRGGVMAGITASIAAVIGTAMGRGPFTHEDPQHSLLLVWAYAICLALGSAILAAAVAERDEADRARAIAEEERRGAEQRSQRSARLESLGVLASGVAHDFNNLLMAIRGSAELVRLQLPDASHAVIESLDEIEAATKRSADLCRQMMAHTGQGRPVTEPIDLARVIDESIRIVRGSISARVTIAFERPDPPCVVIADATQLGTVVVNLLMNSADAIGDSEGRIEIALSPREMDRSQLDRAYIAEHAEPGTFVVLEVTDDGVGMDAATIGHVFEPFFTTKVHGHGLGLSSAAGIVRTHHGALEVESAPGAGTRIAVVLPRAPEGVVVGPTAVSEVPPAVIAGSVLVADDLPAVLKVASRALGLDGWQVHVAEDGRAALELFEASDGIDIVLLDIDMPRLSGIEALRAMRAQRPDLAAILMSGKPPDPGGLPSCEFMAKPFTLAELRAALERARGSSPSEHAVAPSR